MPGVCSDLSVSLAELLEKEAPGWGAGGWLPEPQRCEGARKSTEPWFRLLRGPLGAERSPEDPGASSGARAKTRRPDGGSEPGLIPQRRPLTGQSRQPGGPCTGAPLWGPDLSPRAPSRARFRLGAQAACADVLGRGANYRLVQGSGSRRPSQCIFLEGRTIPGRECLARSRNKELACGSTWCMLSCFI